MGSCGLYPVVDVVGVVLSCPPSIPFVILRVQAFHFVFCLANVFCLLAGLPSQKSHEACDLHVVFFLLILDSILQLSSLDGQPQTQEHGNRPELLQQQSMCE